MTFRTLLASVIGASAAATFAPVGETQSSNQTGTFGIEYGTGRVICTGDSDGRGEGHEVLDESYARSAAWDARIFGSTQSICQPDAPVFETVDSGTWERTAAFVGQDSQGRTAEMRLYVLDAQFTWAFGSSRQIMKDETPARFLFIFGRPMFLSEFCAGDAAVAIGAASFEGARDVNARLARARAGTIGNEMDRLAQSCGEETPPALHYLNLGEFTAETACMRAGTCSGSDTAPQRRVVLIGIAEAEDGVNLAEAVRDGLNSRTAISVVSAADYDLYEFGELGELQNPPQRTVSATVSLPQAQQFVLVPGASLAPRIGRDSGLAATVRPNRTGVEISGPAGELRSSGGSFANAVSFALGDEVENAVSGQLIEVTVDASGGGFAVSYSTNDVGNSGWKQFNPARGGENSFTYRVPEIAAGRNEYLGFRPTSDSPFVISQISVTVLPSDE